MDTGSAGAVPDDRVHNGCGSVLGTPRSVEYEVRGHGPVDEHDRFTMLLYHSAPLPAKLIEDALSISISPAKTGALMDPKLPSLDGRMLGWTGALMDPKLPSLDGRMLGWTGCILRHWHFCLFPMSLHFVTLRP